MPGDTPWWYRTSPSPCPTCGHCPTCGRGGHQFQPYTPWWGIVPPEGTFTVDQTFNSNDLTVTTTVDANPTSSESKVEVKLVDLGMWSDPGWELLSDE